MKQTKQETHSSALEIHASNCLQRARAQETQRHLANDAVSRGTQVSGAIQLVHPQ
jgi:hypothetical protein